MGEVDCLQWRWQQQQLVGVAILAQDSPHSFKAPALDEKGMQEEEPLQGQSIIADTLQAGTERSTTMSEVHRLDISGRVVQMLLTPCKAGSEQLVMPVEPSCSWKPFAF